MLKIHKSHSKKLLVIPITSILSICTLLGINYFTYTPELSHAESVTHEPPKETRTMADITYMQDITPEICANTKEADTAGNNQYQLKDSRDQKTYWVAKLKDGNCWMTQNLALDLWLYDSDSDTTGHGRILTSDDSDFPTGSSWVSISGKPTYIWDTSLDYSMNIVRYYGQKASYYCPTSKSDTCSMKESLNNGHDAVGNYYTWGAATAGYASSVPINDSNGYLKTVQSICPKGWSLPLGGPKNNEISGSFYNLVSRYKAEEPDSNQAIVAAPMFITFPGSVSGKRIQNAGVGGYLWSSVVANGNHIYDSVTWSDTGGMSTSSSDARFNGNSVRCVSIGGEEVIVNNVDIEVNPTISLDVADEVEVEKGETNPSTANLDVKVSSNQKYTVGISAANPNLTSTTTSTTIPAKSGLLNTAENGWGIKLKDNTNYTALTTSLQTFYTASGAEIKTVPFTIGISTAPDLPNGEYSTNITITATQN